MEKLITVDFDAIPKHFDFKNKELEWLSFWDRHQVYRYDEDKDNTFVVDTPPPTVSGSLHIGHVFSYSQTDFLVRFQRMMGKNIYYPMGWDDNGLPTERRVQNLFHIRCNANEPYQEGLTFEKATSKTRKERPTEVSRKNFIELCHVVTGEDEENFKKLWTNLGLSVDWSLEYATISKQSQQVAQLSFLDLYRKGHLYNAIKPIMWDINFQTSIAQAELEDRPVSGNFYHVEFQVENGGSFEIATTRPELLPACVGITAHPDDERYKGLFGKNALTPLFGVPVPIFPSEVVDPEKGTGIVMVCTFGDATDIEWWQEQNLPLRQVLNRVGRFENIEFGKPGWPSVNPETANQHYQELVGKTVFSAKKAIVELLEKETTSWHASAALKKTGESFQRAVKFYEKGDKPLEFIPSRQWFVKLLDKKKEILAKGNQINWFPGFTKERFEIWTENLAYDWNISRQRFFGVPIPVWYPINEKGLVDYESPILPEESQLPVDPSIDVPPGFDEKQRGLPGGFYGETDVFDTWFTSSLSPMINSKWLTNEEQHAKLFPADIRPQAHEIIRTWAFYTIVKALLHEDSIPWRNAVISGWVLDPNKSKMSKSKGNTITPDELMAKYSADGVRYWAAKARLGVDTAFDEGLMKNGLRLSTKMYNAAKLVFSNDGDAGKIDNPLDVSFLHQLAKVVESANQSFNEFNYTVALEETESFFWSNFTDSYIELVKNRAKDGDPSAIAALRLTMSIITRLFAPFQPYITEEIWSWVLAKETSVSSVHQAKFPSVQEITSQVGTKEDQVFEAAKACLQAIHKFKSERQLSVGAFLDNGVIVGNEQSIGLIKAVIDDIVQAGRIQAHSLKVDNSLKELEFTLLEN